MHFQLSQWCVQLIIKHFCAYLFPYCMIRSCTIHTDSIIILKHSAVLCHICIQRFKKDLAVGVKLHIQFLWNSFQNILPVSKVIQYFFWQPYCLDSKKIFKLRLAKLIGAFRQYTLMQSFKIIHIIINCFSSIQFHIIWSVIFNQGKALIYGFSPQDFSIAIDFNNILTVCIYAIFKVIVQKIENYGQYIKTSVFSITIEHAYHLLIWPAVSFKNLYNLFHFCEIVIPLLHQILRIYLNHPWTTCNNSYIGKDIKTISAYCCFIWYFNIIIHKVWHFKLVFIIFNAL